MKYISTRYLIRQLLRYLWLAVLVGILFAAGFFLKNKADSDSVPVETEPAETIVETETKEAKTFADYRGDYLSQPETHRYAVYHLKWESDPVLPLTNTTWKLGDFSWETVNYIKQRLTSGAFSHEWYQTMSKQFPEIKKNQKAFNVLIVEQEMLSIGVDHQANLWIDVRAPLSLNSKEEVYTEKQLCAYRDCLYQLVAATVDSGILTEDLAVSLERVNPVVEDSLSEQVYVVYSLSESKPAGATEEIQVDRTEIEPNKQLTAKKLILAFSLGVLFVEGSVFLICFFDPRIKDELELRKNTDLEILQSTSSQSADLYPAVLNIPDMNLTGEYVLYGIGLLPTEMDTLAQRLQEAFDKVLGPAHAHVTSLSAPATNEEVLAIRGGRSILAVKKLKTTYDDLRDAAGMLAMAKSKVLGAICIGDDTSLMRLGRKRASDI